MNFLIFSNIILFISGILLIIMSYISYRFSRRLLQFDELFEMLVDDIDVNVRYLEKLTSTPLFMDSQEVRTANNNMRIMSARLAEFALQINEAVNRKMPKKMNTENVPNLNPPVVK